MRNWKGRMGGWITMLAAVFKMVLPEGAEVIEHIATDAIALGIGLGIFGIREAQGPSKAPPRG